MQPTPDWPSFHTNPQSLNIRSGIFWMSLEQQYEVYLLDGNDQLFSKQFDDLPAALTFLNTSHITVVNDKYTLTPHTT